MKILISGATGLVGSTLTSAWRSQGHQVLTLVRKSSRIGPHELLWNPPHTPPDLRAIEGLDAMVHLSGEPIAGGRWTAARKAAIRSSRVETTQLLAKAFSQLIHPPKVWICASAIGYYGDRGATVITEADGRGEGFLADVCAAWEAATASAPTSGIRTVHLRTGIVLSLQGGALPTMKRPFDWGIGGPLGDGTQYMSWITLEDLCGLIRFALNHSDLQGPMNGVAPYPVTNTEFSARLAAQLHRPALLRLPRGLARLALGEMADALLYASLRVKPAVAQEAGYRFLFPDLSDALAHLLR